MGVTKTVTGTDGAVTDASASSVVNEELVVHGTSNLYVAGMYPSKDIVRDR